MGFRNPLRSLLASGIIGLIQSSQIVDELVGKIITGALVRTATTGARWELTGTDARTLSAYSGLAAELVPAGISVRNITNEGWMEILSPDLGGLAHATAWIRLYTFSGADTSSEIDIQANQVLILAQAGNLGPFTWGAGGGVPYTTGVVADLRVTATHTVLGTSTLGAVTATSLKVNGQDTPLGHIGVDVVGPAATVDCLNVIKDVVSIAFNVSAGRRYRVTANYNAQQVTVGAGIAKLELDDDQGSGHLLAYDNPTALSSYFVGTGVHWMTANSNRTATVTLRGFTSAGALRSTPNSCSLVVEDIGT